MSSILWSQLSCPRWPNTTRLHLRSPLVIHQYLPKFAFKDAVFQTVLMSGYHLHMIMVLFKRFQAAFGFQVDRLALAEPCCHAAHSSSDGAGTPRHGPMKRLFCAPGSSKRLWCRLSAFIVTEKQIAWPLLFHQDPSRLRSLLLKKHLSIIHASPPYP